MEIRHLNKDNKVPFDQIENGKLFKYEGVIYMKKQKICITISGAPGDYKSKNAIDLRNGALIYVDESVLVLPTNGYFQETE